MAFTVESDKVNDLAEVGDFASVRQILQPLLEEVPMRGQILGVNRTVAYNLGLKAFANAGEIAGAAEWYSMMQNEGVRLNGKTFGKLAEASGKAGRHLEAERWVRLGYVDRFAPDVVQFSLLIDASARAGDAVRSEAWLKRIHSMSSTRPHLAPPPSLPEQQQQQQQQQQPSEVPTAPAGGRPRLDVKFWSPEESTQLSAEPSKQSKRNRKKNKKKDLPVPEWWIMQQQLHRQEQQQQQQAEQARPLHAHIPAATSTSLRPAQSAAMTAWARTGEHRRAELVLSEALEDGTAIEDRLWQNMLDACAKAGDSVRCERWFRIGVQTLGLEAQGASFTALVDACVRAERFSRAEEWFLRMLRRGLDPDSIVATVLLNSCAKRSDLGRGEAWSRRLASLGLCLESRSLTSLITAAASVGDVESAERHFEEIRRLEGKADSIAHTALLQAYLKVAELGKAEEFMRRTLSNPQGPSPDALAFGSIIGAFAEAARPADAELWFLKMLKEGLGDAVSFNSVLLALSKPSTADGHRADLWLERLHLLSFAPDSITFNTVLDSHARSASDAEATDSAFWALEQSPLRSRLEDPHRWPSALTYSIRMRPAAYQGDVDRIEGQWSEMLERRIRPQASNMWALLEACSVSKPPRREEGRRRYDEWIASGGKLDRHLRNALKKLTRSPRVVAPYEEDTSLWPSPSSSSSSGSASSSSRLPSATVVTAQAPPTRPARPALDEALAAALR